MIPWMVTGLEPAQTFIELFQQLCAGSVVCLREYAVQLQECHLLRTFVGTVKDLSLPDLKVESVLGVPPTQVTINGVGNEVLVPYFWCDKLFYYVLI